MINIIFKTEICSTMVSGLDMINCLSKLYVVRGVGRNFSRGGGGVVLNVNF